MAFERLLDPTALLLVLGGTILATLLRSGLSEIGNAFRGVGLLVRRRFSAPRARGALAVQVQQINREGLLRAPLVATADRALTDAIAAMLHWRSVDALLDHHAARRAARERVAGDAVRFFNLAADLGPVFGLAGTLIALTQLPIGGLAPDAISGVVSSAVLTTLYGVLSANLVYGPLARQIARVSEQEEADRQEVVDWLAAQVSAPVAAIAPRIAKAHAA